MKQPLEMKEAPGAAPTTHRGDDQNPTCRKGPVMENTTTIAAPPTPTPRTSTMSVSEAIFAAQFEGWPIEIRVVDGERDNYIAADGREQEYVGQIQFQPWRQRIVVLLVEGTREQHADGIKRVLRSYILGEARHRILDDLVMRNDEFGTWYHSIAIYAPVLDDPEDRFHRCTVKECHDKWHIFGAATAAPLHVGDVVGAVEITKFGDGPWQLFVDVSSDLEDAEVTSLVNDLMWQQTEVRRLNGHTDQGAPTIGDQAGEPAVRRVAVLNGLEPAKLRAIVDDVRVPIGSFTADHADKLSQRHGVEAHVILIAMLHLLHASRLDDPEVVS